MWPLYKIFLQTLSRLAAAASDVCNNLYVSVDKYISRGCATKKFFDEQFADTDEACTEDAIGECYLRYLPALTVLNFPVIM